MLAAVMADAHGGARVGRTILIFRLRAPALSRQGRGALSAMATMAASETVISTCVVGSPILQVRDLRTNLLKPASFSLSAGECVAVRGPSGAGKTLLLRAIADLDPNEGLVCLDGHDRSMIAGPEWRRLIGYVPAEPGWWAETVGEHFSEWTAALAETSDFPGRPRLGRSLGCRRASGCGSHLSAR